MSQQINLINPSLIKKRDFLTIVNIGVMYGVFCLLMLGWFGYTNNQVSELDQKQTALSGELEQLSNSLAQMTAARVPHELDVSLQMQVTKLEAIEQVQTQILTVINQDKSQASNLAEYMRGLARQTIDGLWLTGFSLDQSAHTVTLRGRSVSADVLPLYMKKLGDELVFKGQRFGGLQIQEPTQQLVTNPSSTNDQASSAVIAPQFVEFELKGLEVESHDLVANNLQEKVKS